MYPVVSGAVNNQENAYPGRENSGRVLFFVLEFFFLRDESPLVHHGVSRLGTEGAGMTVSHEVPHPSLHVQGRSGRIGFVQTVSVYFHGIMEILSGVFLDY